MLTEEDRKWLEERRIATGEDGVYCRYCNKRPSIITGGLCAGICPMFPAAHQFRDAAEFEARVAAKLASMDYADVPCAHGMRIFCPRPGKAKQDCGTWCLMREARLAVEAEMEKEGK